MSAQKGKDLLLKLDDGTGNFVTVAGLRTRRFSLNADTVDASSADSIGRWRELLAGAGLIVNFRHRHFQERPIRQSGSAEFLQWRYRQLANHCAGLWHDCRTVPDHQPGLSRRTCCRGHL